MQADEKIVLFFGSCHNGDELAFEIHDSLKCMARCKILKSDNPFEILSYKNKDIVIVDVVKGIDKVTLFRNLSDFKNNNSSSVHNLDLGTVLKLLERTENMKFKIIGVPYGAKKEDAAEEVEKIISSV